MQPVIVMVSVTSAHGGRGCRRFAHEFVASLAVMTYLASSGSTSASNKQKKIVKVLFLEGGVLCLPHYFAVSLVYLPNAP